MSDLAVASTGLTKRFGAQTAVDSVALAVPKGSVYGFLGPNGSGKTTTIRMLMGLVRPTAGECALLGAPMPAAGREVLTRVGALVEGPAFHPHLSGRANLLRLDAADRHAEPRTARIRVDAALERVGLAAAASKRYRAYSLGMKQRLALAGAILQPRELLILDEPTNGLDPQGTREIRRLVGSFAAEGTTVLISSHLLSEVEQICDHVGIMSRGQLLAQDPIAAMLSRLGQRVWLATPDHALASQVLVGLGLSDLQLSDAGPTPTLTARPAQDSALEGEDVVAALVGAGVRVREFRLLNSRLEDVFVALTGEGFNVSG